jgi:Tol biopolymer transport system component
VLQKRSSIILVFIILLTLSQACTLTMGSPSGKNDDVNEALTSDEPESQPPEDTPSATKTIPSPSTESTQTDSITAPDTEEITTCPENGDRIIFARNIMGPGESANFEVFSSLPDGLEIAQLTDNSTYDGYPSWSPNRCQIAFSSNVGNQSEEIFIMNADGTGLVRLTDDSHKNKMPTWSPDGSRIAYESERDGQGEIFIINIDGTDLLQLTDDPAEDQWLEWSPHSEQIAFSSRRDGNWEIYIVGSDGSGLTNLTNHTMQDSHPAWSPDGSRIAFLSNRTSYVEIFIMNADGSSVTQVTNYGSDLPEINSGRDLAWSPDGQRLVFIASFPDSAMTHGIEDVFTIKLDGSELFNLTDNALTDSNPDW